MKPLFRRLATATLFATALSAASFAAEVADQVYTGGKIWTGRSDAVDAEAIAVKGDRILAVGRAEDMAAHMGPDTETILLNGRFLMPGMMDNHVHFEMGSVGLAQVQLRDAATPQEFARRIGEAAKAASEGAWIVEGSWDHELWGGELPDRAWVDELTGDVPVAVSRLDGHMILANTAALELADIDADTPDPEGGVIVRDEAGRATGVLKDNAANLVFAVIPPLSDAAMEEAFLRGMRHAVENGVTQVHDMGYNWRSLETFQRLRAKGEMSIRVYSFTPLAEWERMAAYVKENGRGDDWLRWGALKGFVDGSLGSTTAWFYEPYTDEPDTSGFPVADLPELEADVLGAAEAGLHVTVHAIGYQANDKLLDIFERVEGKVAREDLRFRIEHAQHLTAAAIERFDDLGVIASMHPYHLIDDGRWAEKRIGKARLKGTYALGSVMKAGAHVTFGSDWSVAPLKPLLGIYAAVTRRTLDGKNPDGWIADEKVSVVQALKAYTAENAFAGYQEDRLGILKPGYLADFVVLAYDPFEMKAEKLDQNKVLRTVVGGKTMYELPPRQAVKQP
ncbi:amidohydrolase [Kordiimonas gwangyangensis]|uniref:amidohydrolase n=1 Tax=Kordiimonas gwangyangensis TaxID=288022 RepID=UPI0003648B90|nr:amidohydrolase [Kordiimonas gwangyangensis]